MCLLVLMHVRVHVWRPQVPDAVREEEEEWERELLAGMGNDSEEEAARQVQRDCREDCAALAQGLWHMRGPRGC